MPEVVVIKCGGTSVEHLEDSFFDQLKNMIAHGMQPVIVHGGGGEIKELLDDLQLESTFIDGLRQTTKETMDVVEMVLAGKVNKTIVRKLNRVSIEAVGLSGSDGRLLTAEAKDIQKYGCVGDVTKVRRTILDTLFASGMVPVIAPVAVDTHGNCLNVNADTVAGAVAVALQAKRLLFVTDVAGIMHDGQILATATEEDISELIHCGAINGGMLPKVEAALKSIQQGVKEVIIFDGNQAGAHASYKFEGTTITM